MIDASTDPDIVLSGGRVIVLKKILWTLASMVALYFCAGYLTAWLSKQACIDESYRSAQQRDVRGTNMAGRVVRPKLSEFEADIVGPFKVEVSYSIPRGMHATTLVDRYSTLPWQRRVSSRDEIHYVIAPCPVYRERILADASRGNDHARS
ncbi:MAG: hypothetical protein ACREP7_02020 [Lysobacter sp.]